MTADESFLERARLITHENGRVKLRKARDSSIVEFDESQLSGFDRSMLAAAASAKSGGGATPNEKTRPNVGAAGPAETAEGPSDSVQSSAVHSELLAFPTVGLYYGALHDALRRGDYDYLEAVAHAAREDPGSFSWSPTSGKLEVFYQLLGEFPELPPGDGPAPLAVLEQWRAARPDSQTPLLAMAARHINVGWRVRGAGVSSTVGQEAWRQFDLQLRRAGDLLAAAMALPGGDPDVYRQLFEVDKGICGPAGDMTALAELLMEKAPLYFPAHQARVVELLPRWRGRRGELESYAADVAQRIGGDDGARMYARMVQAVQCYYSSVQLRAHHRFDYPLFDAGMRQLAAADPLDARLPQEAYMLAVLYADRPAARHWLGVIEQMPNASLSDEGYLRFAQAWARQDDDEPGPLRSMGSRVLPGGVRQLRFLAGDQLLAVTGDASGHSQIQIVGAAIMNATMIKPIDTEGVVVDWSAASGNAGLRVLETMPNGASMLGRLWLEPEWPPAEDLLDRSLRRIAESFDGAYGAVASSEGAVVLLKCDSDEVFELAQPNDIECTELCFASDGTMLAAGFADGRLLAWRVADRTPVELGLDPPADEAIVGIRWLDDGRMCLGRRNGQITVVAVTAGQVAQTIACPAPLTDFAVSPDGRLLVAASDSEPPTLQAWSLARQTLLEDLEGHRARVASIDFSSDGRMLATGSVDGVVRLWIAKKLAPDEDD